MENKSVMIHGITKHYRNGGRPEYSYIMNYEREQSALR